MKDMFIADLHNDTVIQMIRGYDIAVRHDDYHIDLPRLKEGGVDLAVFACCANSNADDEYPFKVAQFQLDTLKKGFAANPDKIEVLPIKETTDFVIWKSMGGCFSLNAFSLTFNIRSTK